jgi:hypothetical protein
VDKGQKMRFFASKKVENKGMRVCFFYFAKNELKVFISFCGKKNTFKENKTPFRESNSNNFY